MCTLSVIPTTDRLGRTCGYRAVMSRDETRDRSPARHPEARDLDSAQGVWPTDADAGGTWFAASERGLTLALLNVNLGPHEPPNRGVRTRGEIIPSLIDRQKASEAATELRNMNLERYRPFRLVAISRRAVIDCRWDRMRLVERRRRLSPACFVSSGLGDHIVSPRLMLFDSTFSGVSGTAKMQDAFHQHVWPGHEAISVMMSRDDARTTSVTTVEMRWEEDADGPAGAMTHRDDAGSSEIEIGGLVAAGA